MWHVIWIQCLTVNTHVITRDWGMRKSLANGGGTGVCLYRPTDPTLALVCLLAETANSAAYKARPFYCLYFILWNTKCCVRILNSNTKKLTSLKQFSIPNKIQSPHIPGRTDCIWTVVSATLLSCCNKFNFHLPWKMLKQLTGFKSKLNYSVSIWRPAKGEHQKEQMQMFYTWMH